MFDFEAEYTQVRYARGVVTFRASADERLSLSG
jgi:hypothetical protein